MGSQGRRTSWARGVPSGLLLAVLLAWPGAAGSQSAGPSGATGQGLQISWSPDWTATDIVVAEKDVLLITIEASEQGGAADGALRQLRDRLAASGELYAFTGRIGDGPAFKVDRNFRQIMTSAGRLSLRWDVPREYARLVPALSVGIELEPAPKPDPDPDPDPDPTRNAIEADGNLSAGGNEAAPASELSNLQGEGDNILEGEATGPGPVGGGPAGDGEGDKPATGLGRAIPWVAGGAALLLLAAATLFSLRRWERRRTVERTRSLLAVSPSLDLAEGACRGGSLPADGPAASLRARLEEGAIRCVEGGEDG